MTLVTGDKELDRRLRSLPPKVLKKLARRAVRPAAKEVLARAIDEVPVDTGDLEDSLKVRALKRSRKNKDKVGSRVVTGEGFFKGDQYYGGFVEFGTSKMAARPFLRPAAISAEPAVKRVFTSAMKRIVKEL